MEKVKNELLVVAKFFDENPGVRCEVNEFEGEPNAEPDKVPFLQQNFGHLFYRNYKHGTLKWKLADGDADDLRLTGSINMLTVNEVNRDWKGIVYFDSTPNTSPLRLFKPIDLFSDDACAGVYENDPLNTMHLYSYEGEPLNLKLSIDNYLLMALSFKGFYFWHYIVQYFLDGVGNEVLQDYESFSGTRRSLYSAGELKTKYNQLKQP